MARLSTRHLWKAKLEGRLPAAPSVRAPGRNGRVAIDPTVRQPFRGRILGIDPSLRGTGLAVLEVMPGRPPLLLHSRTLRLRGALTMPDCLGEIFRGVSEVLALHPIDHVALEQTIYVQNFQTAQILGAARGAAIAAAAVRALPVFEYPPLRVKQAVVGVGRASKEQVARTVMNLLGHGRALEYDQADAAGVALCHAFTWRGAGGG